VVGPEVLLVDCSIKVWIDRARVIGTIAVSGSPVAVTERLPKKPSPSTTPRCRADGTSHSPSRTTPHRAETSDLRTLPSTIAMYRAALALAGPATTSRGGAAGFLGFAAWEQGDVSSVLGTLTEAVTSARHHLNSAAALTDRVATNESRYRWFVSKALLARVDGDPDQAVQHLNQAEQRYRPGFTHMCVPIAAIKARTWIMQDKLAEAADWARGRGVSTTDEARYLSEFDHLTLVRLLLARYRAHQDTSVLVQAAALLDRLFGSAGIAERAGSLLEIRLLQALVQDAQGHREQARQTLAQAVELAPEPDGYRRLFLDEGASAPRSRAAPLTARS
jgi:LuxR family maltose regulon positive regulatory protein